MDPLHEDSADPFQFNRDQYLPDRNAETFGTANPSIMEKPFWKYMIARGGDSYSARKLFRLNEEEDLFEDMEPVWCFSRFGRTQTVLPDGRHVLIGGEHEDFYDPDFCIYNDVVVFSALRPSDLGPCNGVKAISESQPSDSGSEDDDHWDYAPFKEPFPMPTSPESITVYGYPVDIFPPTDFHTSTFFRDPISGIEYIFIIGGLGYRGSDSRDRTDVYRLDVSDFSMHRVETSGAKPAGGTDRHEARLIDGVVDDDGVVEAAIEITRKDGSVFSLLINKSEWISHGSSTSQLEP